MITLRRHRPDYARIAELEKELYGRVFDHARPAPQPRLRPIVRFTLAACWVMLAESVACWAFFAPLLRRDWTPIFAPLLVSGGTAFYWFVTRMFYGTPGNRPPSAYRAGARPPASSGGFKVTGAAGFWSRGQCAPRNKTITASGAGSIAVGGNVTGTVTTGHRGKDGGYCDVCRAQHWD